MPKITVITPTVRPEGMKLVEKALNRQTFKDFEHIVVMPEGEKPAGLVWTLNRDYNRAIRQAKADLIVSWQDYTFAPHDTLERFYRHFEHEPKTLVGAVGNKYQDEQFIIEVWRDPRLNTQNGTYYPCYFQDIEWNLCSVPRQALYEVGGFDEELDQWYGMDGYSVNDRISMIGGYEFKLDQLIKSYSMTHGRAQDWEEKNAIHGPYQAKRSEYLKNPRLSYL